MTNDPDLNRTDESDVLTREEFDESSEFIRRGGDVNKMIQHLGEMMRYVVQQIEGR